MGLLNTSAPYSAATSQENRGNAVLAIEYFRARRGARGRSALLRQHPPTRPAARGEFYPPEHSAPRPTIGAVNSVLAGYPGTTPIAGTGAYKGSLGVNTRWDDFQSTTDLAAPQLRAELQGSGHAEKA